MVQNLSRSVLQKLVAIVLLAICESAMFTDSNFNSVASTLKDIESPYASITTANERYGHSIVKEGELSCSPHIVRVSDLSSLQADRSRPQVLISGEIHGDERVGPLVTIPLAQLLVWSPDCVIRKDKASCERLDAMQGITDGQRTWLAFLATRRETIILPTANCMGYMKNSRSDGWSDPNRDYPYSRKDDRCFLSSSARLFKAIMETTIVQSVVTFHGGMVALGYEWGSRNHLGPKDRSPDENAHRVIGELMGKTAGTFGNEKPYPVGRVNTLIYPVEGGMEDWLYAAGWDKGPLRKCAGEPEPAGTAIASDAAENRAVVFLVETSDRKKPLESTLGGTEKILDVRSRQNGHVPRNVRLSLTAIDLVQPYVCLERAAVRYASRPANAALRRALRGRRGHHQHAILARRLQVSVQDIPSNTSDRTPSSVIEEKSIPVPGVNIADPPTPPPREKESETSAHVQAGIDVEWYIGGGRAVDCTFLSWHKPEQVAGKLNTHDWSAYLAGMDAPQQQEVFRRHCSGAALLSPMGREEFPVLASPAQKGQSRWFTPTGAVGTLLPDARSAGNVSDSLYQEDDPLRPKSSYRATVSPSFAPAGESADKNSVKIFPPGRYLLVSWSMVDQSFGDAKQGFPAEALPQSHLANVRTNPAYHKKVGDRAIVGRLFWPSDPIEVEVYNNGTYQVHSLVTHCAWWDRRQPDGSIASQSAVSTKSSAATPPALPVVKNDFLRDIFDTAAYVPAEEMRGSASKLFAITLGLLLITAMCCVCLYNHWRRGNIYTQVANNKYFNQGGLQRSGRSWISL